MLSGTIRCVHEFIRLFTLLIFKSSAVTQMVKIQFFFHPDVYKKLILFVLDFGFVLFPIAFLWINCSLRENGLPVGIDNSFDFGW